MTRRRRQPKEKQEQIPLIEGKGTESPEGIITKETPEEPGTDMNRKNFLAAIKTVLPGIAEKSSIEQSDLVLFDMERLVSFNDEIAISHPFDIGHHGGVHATELYKLLQKFQANDIDINEYDEEGTSQFILTCGNTQAGFYVVKDINIPNLGLDKDMEWHNLPSDFCHGLAFCSETAAADVSKGVLTCIVGQKDYLLSCDNFRATKYDLTSGLPEGVELKVPRRAAKDLSDHEPVEFAVDESWIHFRNSKNTIFSTRTMADEYPDVLGLFGDMEGQKIQLPEALKESLSRAEILADEHARTKNRFVKIFIKDSYVVCKASRKVGWLEEKIKTDFEGDLPPILISPTQLSYILERTQEATIGEKKIMFSAKGFSHVVFLMSDETVEDKEE